MKPLEYKFYLDNNRFAAVGFFNDQLRIGICQYQKSKYDASKLFPTVTRMSLLEDEWRQITKHCNTVTEEVKKNILAKYHLGNDKYLGISHYGQKGPITISIRQHYTFDDGVLRPTKKGINLKRKEWDALVLVKCLVDEAVNNLKSKYTCDGKTIVKSVYVHFADKRCYQYGIVETS